MGSRRFEGEFAAHACAALSEQQTDATPPSAATPKKNGLTKPERHSHSIVPGGLDVTSSTTRLTPGTSLVIRLEMRASTS